MANTNADGSKIMERTTAPAAFIAVGFDGQCAQLNLPNADGTSGNLPIFPNKWFSKGRMLKAIGQYHQDGLITWQTAFDAGNAVTRSSFPENDTAWDLLFDDWVVGFGVSEDRRKAKEAIDATKARVEAHAARAKALAESVRAWYDEQGITNVDSSKLEDRLASAYGDLDLSTASLVKNEDGTFTFSVRDFDDGSGRDIDIKSEEVLPNHVIAHKFVHVLDHCVQLDRSKYHELHKVAFDSDAEKGDLLGGLMGALGNGIPGLSIEVMEIGPNGIRRFGNTEANPGSLLDQVLPKRGLDEIFGNGDGETGDLRNLLEKTLGGRDPGEAFRRAFRAR